MTNSLGRTVRVFISSTFQDMHNERDFLIKEVFPELRARCEKRNIFLVDIDLRWGINEEEIEKESILSLCLNEVDQCRPFFIGLLGDRYGSIPKEILPSDFSQFEWIQHSGQGHSYTALEIYHALMHNNSDQKTNAFFYFRSPSFQNALSEEQLNIFCSGSEDEKHKLESLKNEIRLSVNKCKMYFVQYKGVDEFGQVRLEGLEDLGEQIKENLWNKIQELYPEEEEEKDEYQLEVSYQQIYRREKSQFFVGQKKYIDQITSKLNGDENQSIIVIGESGYGKSSLLSHIHSQYEEKNFRNITGIYIGGSPKSMITNEIMYYLCKQIVEKLSLHLEVPMNQDDIIEFIPNLLNQINGKFVIIFDAVNQLNTTKDELLKLLKLFIHPNTQIVVSTTDDKMIRRLTDVFPIRLGAIDEQDQREYISKNSSVFRKSVASDVIDQLIKKNKDKSPLYLKIALEELRLFAPKGEYKPNALLDKVNGFADTVEGLFHQLLTRLEDDFGEKLVEKSLSLVLHSKFGLYESEIITLLAEGEDPFPRRYWSRLFYQLKPYLTNVGENGFIRFFHSKLEKVIEEHYSRNDNIRKGFHRTFSEYYTKNADLPRSLDVIVFHQTEGQEWDSYKSTIFSIEFMKKRIVHQQYYHLVNDYTFTLDHPLIPDAFKERISEFYQFLMANGSVLRKNPEMIYQLAMNLHDSDHIVGDAMEALLNKDGEPITILQLENKTLFNPNILVSFEGHNSMITACAFSTDKTLVASGGENGWIKVWDMRTGRSKWQIQGHIELNIPNSVTSCVFSQNGKYLSSTDRLGRIKIWDVNNGELIHQWTHQEGVGCKSSFSNDSSKLMTYSSNGKIKVWNIEDEEHNLIDIYVGSPLLSPVTFSKQGGEYFLFGTGNNVFYSTGEYDYEYFSGYHTASFYSPNEQNAFLVRENNTILVYENEKDDLLRLGILMGLKYSITSYAFSNDHNRLYIGDKNGFVNIWDLHHLSVGHLDQSWEATTSYQICENSIHSMTFHSVRPLLLITSEIGECFVRNIENNETVFRYHCPEPIVEILEFHEDKAVMLLRNGNIIELHFQNELSNTHTLPNFNHNIYAVDDEKWRIFYTTKDQIHVFDWNNNMGYTYTLEDRHITHLNYDTKTQCIVTYCQLKQSIEIWNTVNFERVGTIESVHDINFNGIISQIIVSPELVYIAVVLDDESKRLWKKTNHGEYRLELKKRKKNPLVYDVFFSQTGGFIYTIFSNGYIKIWEVTGKEYGTFPLGMMKGKLQKEFRGTSLIDDDRIINLPVGGDRNALPYTITGRNISLSSDEKFLAVVHYNGRISIWDTETAEEVKQINDVSGTNCVFSPDDTQLLIATEKNELVILGMKEKKEKVICHEDQITALVYSHDDNLLFSVSNDGRESTIKVWNTLTYEEIIVFKIKIKYKVNKLIVDSVNRYVTAIHEFRFITTWSFDGVKVSTIKLDGDISIRSAVLASNLDFITATDGEKIYIWDYPSGQLRTSIEACERSNSKLVTNTNRIGHRSRITDLTITFDNQHLITTSFDSNIKIWDIATGSVARTLTGHEHQVMEAILSPNGKALLSYSDDKSLKLWNLEEDNLPISFEGHPSGIAVACFSPCGNYILSGCLGGILKLWDVKNGEEMWSKNAHTDIAYDSVGNFQISPNGKYAISLGSLDHCLKIWDVKSGNLLTEYIVETNHSSILMTKDDQIIVGDKFGRIHYLSINNYGE